MAKDFGMELEAAVQGLREAVHGGGEVNMSAANPDSISTQGLTFAVGGSPEAQAYASAILSQGGGIERGQGMAI